MSKSKVSISLSDASLVATPSIREVQAPRSSCLGGEPYIPLRGAAVGSPTLDAGTQSTRRKTYSISTARSPLSQAGSLPSGYSCPPSPPPGWLAERAKIADKLWNLGWRRQSIIAPLARHEHVTQRENHRRRKKTEPRRNDGFPPRQALSPRTPHQRPHS